MKMRRAADNFVRSGLVRALVGSLLLVVCAGPFVSCAPTKEPQMSEDSARGSDSQSTSIGGEKTIGVHITKAPSGRYAVSFSHAPAWAHVLAGHKLSAEPELRSGTWLVVVFAVWSSPDISCVYDALKGLSRHAPRVQLGVRPFERYEEAREFSSGLAPVGPSPLWLFLVDGNVTHYEHGPRSAQEVDRMVTELSHGERREEKSEKRSKGTKTGQRNKNG